MMMKSLIILFTSFLINSLISAQTTISGFITSDKGDTIPGANIFIQNSYDGCSSGLNGTFSFTTNESGNKILIARMIGYEPYQKEIIIAEKNLEIKITLTEKITGLSPVEIIAGQFETGDAGKMAVLNSLDVATTAGATADIYGALKTLPGTQPASESDGLFVRGGDAHESKTFFDGLLVKNPFTSDLPDIAQRGRFSPFMFKGTSFSTAAYSSQYGQALSSTMSMESKDLSTKTKSDIGIMTVGMDATHSHQFENSSLDLNASYYNLKPVFSIVKQNVEWTKAPESVNANAFYKLKTGENGLFKLYMNYEHSHIGIKSDDLKDITKLVNYNINSDHAYFLGNWQQFIGSNWKVNIGAAYGDDVNRILIDTNQVHQNEKSLHSRIVLTHYYGKQSNLKAGLEYFHFSNNESYNDNEHSLNSPVLASFLESNLYLSDQLALRAGLRYEQSEIIEQHSLAPRISLAYKYNDHSQVSLAYGKFYQLPEDKYLFTSKTLGFENASHYVLNYQYQKGNKTFRIEAYSKKYDELIKINNQEPSGMNNSGYGYARGLDLFFRDKQSLRRLDYWVTYSFLDTKRNYHDFPKEATPTFVANHVFNAVGKYFIPSLSTNIGASYTYASGRPYFNPNATEFLSNKTKDYHNFSMNVSYLTSIAKRFTIIYLSVENVFGIQNVFGYRYSPDGTMRKPITPSAPRNIFVGIFITFGDNSYR